MQRYVYICPHGNLVQTTRYVVPGWWGKQEKVAGRLSCEQLTWFIMRLPFRIRLKTHSPPRPSRPGSKSPTDGDSWAGPNWNGLNYMNWGNCRARAQSKQLPSSLVTSGLTASSMINLLGSWHVTTIRLTEKRQVLYTLVWQSRQEQICSVRLDRFDVIFR